MSAGKIKTDADSVSGFTGRDHGTDIFHNPTDLMTNNPG
jgi:hypothetical protein